MDTSDARALSQPLRTPNGWRTVQVCREIFWDHLQHVALVTEPIPGRENERVFRPAVRKVGVDPHFAYANMLADVAWARDPRMTRMLFEPTVRVLELPSVPSSPEQQQLEDAMPWLFDRPDPSLNCGNCTQFDPARNRCILRNFDVKPETPPCDFYDPLPEDSADY